MQPDRDGRAENFAHGVQERDPDVVPGDPRRQRGRFTKRRVLAVGRQQRIRPGHHQRLLPRRPVAKRLSRPQRGEILSEALISARGRVLPRPLIRKTYGKRTSGQLCPAVAF